MKIFLALILLLGAIPGVYAQSDEEELFSTAQRAFDELITQYPSHQMEEDATLKIAESIYHVGHFPGAIKAFQEYLSAYPQSSDAADVNLNIADGYYYMEDYNQALPYYEKAARLST